MKAIKFKSRRYSGLHGPAKAWLLASLRSEFEHMVVVCRDRRSAESLFEDLSFFVHPEQLFSFIAWDTLPFEHVSPQTHISAQRLTALARLAAPASYICVLSVDAITQKTLDLEFLQERSFVIQLEQHPPYEELISKLSLAGYTAVSLVEEVGQMAVHGAVVDFFPAHRNEPIRLEFKQHTLTDIRSFDSDSQRSLAALSQIEVFPVREYHAGKKLADQPAAIEALKLRAHQLETPPRELKLVMDALQSATPIPGIELFETIVQPLKSSVFSFMSSETLLVINDQIGVEQSLDAFEEIINERLERMSQAHQLVPAIENMYLSSAQVLEQLRGCRSYFVDHLEVVAEEEESSLSSQHRPQSLNLKASSNLELVTKLKTKVGSGEAFAPLGQAINQWRRQDYHVCLVVGSTTRAERLHRILLDLDLDAQVLAINGLEWIQSGRRYPLVILEGQLSSGVQIPGEKLVFVAESEIFGERSYRKSKKAKTSLKKLLGALAQLSEGDFVVHSDYGIGRYQGLKHLEISGTESDFLHVEYADSVLYLPVQNIGKIQKYVAAEGLAPELDKLGSNRWVKTKAKVREAVIPLAGDLIKLYATRSVAKGWRYEPFGAEDERFADNFPYSETADQMKAIKDSLADMASERPMDRLVCGDVGFGKTEVALRAAYKCTQHAKQVAVLVPTTILVEQHKNNFKQRFNGYPVKVGAVSRFYNPAANKQALQALADGELDIIIGTHRLLSRDVSFKDLGLLIIDEEHRFGVKQKEQIKSLKKQIDVLTLTATPIPRTLHLSLLGIRDISVISTPPHDRRSIRTYIATYEDSLVRDAILRELQRNGQCFYLHNRIDSIEGVTQRLRLLVPEARFEFAHGQMSEHQLEKIMFRFFQHEIDVLISTTIIESGLDIPNANTMIIERADTFGLAQLYQIRGRVGRSSRQAYAYFLVPKSLKLGTEAQQRLKALQSLDDLGLGFNLALRDMEIRGAGNLLGKEQSGNVLAVGFDLYCSILKEAVLHLKGEEVELEETIDPEVKIEVRAFIPEDYIPDLSERLVLYQRLSSVHQPQEIDELVSEIEDRYGSIGSEVQNLIDLMTFRSVLRCFGVVKAELSINKLLFSFSPRASIDGDKIIKLMQSEPEKYRFGKNHTLTISADFSGYKEPTDLYQFAEEVLRSVQRAK